MYETKFLTNLIHSNNWILFILSFLGRCIGVSARQSQIAVTLAGRGRIYPSASRAEGESRVRFVGLPRKECGRRAVSDLVEVRQTVCAPILACYYNRGINGASLPPSGSFIHL